MVVDKNTGLPIHGYSAPDHPCYGRKGGADVFPHPFVDYYNKPLPGNMEIVLVDLEDTMKMKDMDLADIMASIKIGFGKEEAFKARDMDGKNVLAEKHPSYSVRKLKAE